MRISEILRKAANEFLSTDGTEPCGPVALNTVRGPWVHTCDAARSAGWHSGGNWAQNNRMVDFLRSLGCGGSAQEFDDVHPRERQQARYAWLMFASMYAAELESKGEL